MRFEFDKGIPEGCTQWLRENVGIGNIEHSGNRTQQWMTNIPEYAWFYERIKRPNVLFEQGDDPWLYVPTITVKDAKKSTLFALRWLS